MALVRYIGNPVRDRDRGVGMIQVLAWTAIGVLPWVALAVIADMIEHIRRGKHDRNS